MARNSVLSGLHCCGASIKSGHKTRDSLLLSWSPGGATVVLSTVRFGHCLDFTSVLQKHLACLSSITYTSSALKAQIVSSLLSSKRKCLYLWWCWRKIIRTSILYNIHWKSPISTSAPSILTYLYRLSVSYQCTDLFVVLSLALKDNLIWSMQNALNAFLSGFSLY